MVIDGRIAGQGQKRDIFGTDEFCLSLDIIPAQRANNPSNSLILFSAQMACLRCREVARVILEIVEQTAHVLVMRGWTRKARERLFNSSLRF